METIIALLNMFMNAICSTSHGLPESCTTKHVNADGKPMLCGLYQQLA